MAKLKKIFCSVFLILGLLIKSTFSLPQKPQLYWYWVENAGARKNLHSTSQRDYVYYYYWNMDLCRRIIDESYQIPLSGTPSAFTSIWSKYSNINPDHKQFTGPRIQYQKVAGTDSVSKKELILEFETGYAGTGWHGRSQDESVNLDLEMPNKGFTIHNYFFHVYGESDSDSMSRRNSQIYTSIEQLLTIFNQARHYEYGPNKKDYEAVESPSGKLLDICHSLIYHKTFFMFTPLLNTALFSKNLPIRYGDRVKLISTGSCLTLMAEDSLEQTSKVSCSHYDTPDQRDRLKKIIPSTKNPEDNFWFIIKGPFKQGCRWNCKVGSFVKNNDVIRLEHLSSGKNLLINYAGSPPDGNLLLGEQLGFTDTRYRGSPGIAAPGAKDARSSQYVYQNKAASDERMITLSQNSIGDETCNITIVGLNQSNAKIKDNSSIDNLVLGGLFALRVSSKDEDFYFWSQHAFFTESKSKNYLGIVSALKLNNIEEDLSTSQWFCLNTDSPNASELKKIEIQLVAEFGSSPEQQFAALCHLVLQDSNKAYFNQISAPDGTYPQISSQELAIVFLDVLKDFFNNTPPDFWIKKFDGSPTALKKVLTKLKSSFPDSESLLKQISDFENNVLSNNPAFQQDSFRESLLQLNQMFTNNKDKSDDIKSLINKIINNKTWLFEKTGFQSKEDFFDLKTEAKNLENSQIGASIFLAWLKQYKDALISINAATQSEIDSWIKILQNAENNIYVGNASSEIGQAVVSELKNLMTELTNLDSLSLNNKNSLIQKLKNLFAGSYDKMLSQEDSVEITSKIKLLKAKFNLEEDLTIGKDFKAFYDKIINLTTFGTEFLIGQSKMILAKLSNLSDDQSSEATTLIDDLIEVLNSMKKYRAGLYFLEPTVLSNYLEEFRSKIQKIPALKSHEESFEDKNYKESEKKISVLLQALNESPLLEDFMLLLNLISNQIVQQTIVPSSIDTLAKKVVAVLSKEPLKNLLSKNDFTKISANIDVIRQKGISVVEPKLDANAFSFDNFLVNRKKEIITNKNASQTWTYTTITNNDSKSNLNFMEFCNTINKADNFSPDFTNDKHKYGFISVLKFVYNSIKAFKERLTDDAFMVERLDQIALALKSKYTFFKDA